MSLAPCPVGRMPAIRTEAPPCPTMLQPYQGRLSAGISQHLSIVHRMPTELADEAAARWIKAGCRATR